MTALLKFLLDMSGSIVKDDAEAERTIETVIQQRVAVGLLQARAAEARHLAGEILIKGLAQIPMMAAMRGHLLDREHRLEAYALKMCEQWPPPDMEIPDDEMVPLIKQQYLPKDFVIGRTLSVRMPTSMTGGLVETVRLITLTGELIVRLREAEGGIS